MKLSVSFLRIFAFSIAFLSAIFFLYSLLGKYFSAADPIVVVVDLSYRMNVQDMKDGSGTTISRLDRVKYHVRDLVYTYSGSPFSLVILQNDPHIIVPLTYDTGSFLLALDYLVANKGLSGFDIATFLKNYRSDFGNFHSLVVFSDFTDIEGYEDTSCHNCLFVGMGTSFGGYIMYPNGAFYRDLGKKVLHRFDPVVFEKIVEKINTSGVVSSKNPELIISSSFFDTSIVSFSHVVLILLIVLSFFVLL